MRLEFKNLFTNLAIKKILSLEIYTTIEDFKFIEDFKIGHITALIFMLNL